MTRLGAPRDRREGMALLTVLLLIAVMSVMAVAVLDDIRFGVRRSQNARAVGQAQWYALGAEQLAQLQIRRLVAASPPGYTTLAGGWNGRPFVLPLDDGGVLRVRVRDGGNCFNLNSVVGSAGLTIRNDAGAAQFVSLMVALQVSRPEAEAVADALVDWADFDDVPQPLGAEDEAYARGSPAYRTAGAPLAEASELRAVRGVTPRLYARLRPHVCALPFTSLSPININTLLEGDAILLTMMTDGRVSPERARQIILDRPPEGWRDSGELVRNLRTDALPAGVTSQLRTATRFFALEAEVDHGGADVVLSALLEHDGARNAQVIARRWTVDE